jgi:hypothetical protein
MNLSHYAPITPPGVGEFGKNVTVLTIFWIVAIAQTDTSSGVGAAAAFWAVGQRFAGARESQRRPAVSKEMLGRKPSCRNDLHFWV